MGESVGAPGCSSAHTLHGAGRLDARQTSSLVHPAANFTISVTAGILFHKLQRFPVFFLGTHGCFSKPGTVSWHKLVVEMTECWGIKLQVRVQQLWLPLLLGTRHDGSNVQALAPASITFQGAGCSHYRASTFIPMLRCHKLCDTTYQRKHGQSMEIIILTPGSSAMMHEGLVMTWLAAKVATRSVLPQPFGQATGPIH